MWELLAAVLAADLATGVFHWIEDRYGSERWPRPLYEAIVEPNMLHHECPQAFTRGGYWERNKLQVLPCVVLAGIALAFAWSPAVLLFLLLLSHANEIHCWAHTKRDRLPRPVRWLQAVGLLQSQRHHGRHHQAPFDDRFCILTDWLNPILDTVRFWRLLEALCPFPVAARDSDMRQAA